MDGLYITCLAIAGLLIFVSSLDDLLIDILIALKLKSPRIKPLPALKHNDKTKPKIAIFVANWHEADVLGRMVEGNLANLSYRPLKFVLGVYPNDTDTRRVAEEVAKKHPELIEVVVNRRDGPTSKGQMLNEMFARVFEDREYAPDLVVMHDSEDMISPRSFDVYAHHAKDSALIQIPVFSLDSRRRSLVGATYMEEFAERHTREMLLRSHLGAFVPSAGVGTGLRKDLIVHLLNLRGYVLQSGSVTEDYILGADAHDAGFKTTFAAHSDPSHTNEPIIATLEYFPKDLWASIKQKTRWVYGIAFESLFQQGWSERGWDRFFQYRDRKGSIANLLPVLSLAVLITGLILQPDFSQMSPWIATLLFFVLAANTANIFLRIFFRARSFREVYGTHNIIGLLLRWPVAFFVNAAAVTRAWRMFFVESKFATRPVTWSKTTHEVPESFAFVQDLAASAQTAPVRIPIRAIRFRTRQFINQPSFQATVAMSLAAFAVALSDNLVTPSSVVFAERAKARHDAITSLDAIRRQQNKIAEAVKETKAASQRYASLVMDATNSHSDGNIVRVVGDTSLPQHAPPRQTRATIVSDVQSALQKTADTENEFLALVNFTRDAEANPRILLQPAALSHKNKKTNKYSLLKSRSSKPITKPDEREDRLSADFYARLSLAAAKMHEQTILSQHKTILTLQATNSPAVARKLAAISILDGAVTDQKITRRIVQSSVKTKPTGAQPSPTKRNKPERATAYKSNSNATDAPPNYNWAAARVLSEAHDHVLTMTHSAIDASKHHDKVIWERIELARQNDKQNFQALKGNSDTPFSLPFRTAQNKRKARFLARVAISTSTSIDKSIIARHKTSSAQKTPSRKYLNRNYPPSPTELTTLDAASVASVNLNQIHKHNAQILSAMIEGVPNSPAPFRKKVSATQAVYTAQKKANAWLKRQKIKVRDLGLKGGGDCGGYLCADGLLGIRTKQVLDEIAQKDESFWRFTTRTASNSKN